VLHHSFELRACTHPCVNIHFLDRLMLTANSLSARSRRQQARTNHPARRIVPLSRIVPLKRRNPVHNRRRRRCLVHELSFHAPRVSRWPCATGTKVVAVPGPVDRMGAAATSGTTQPGFRLRSIRATSCHIAARNEPNCSQMPPISVRKSPPSERCESRRPTT